MGDPTTATDGRPGKRKVSLSLDAEVVAELEAGGSLSAQVNEVLVAEIARRRRQVALQALVQELVERYDGLDEPDDRAAIARYEDLLR